MIIKVDGSISHDTLKEMIARLEAENNVKVKLIVGEEYSILGLVGDISTIDIKHIQSLDYVLDVQRVQEPYKRASRKFHPEDTIVKVGDVEVTEKGSDGDIAVVIWNDGTYSYAIDAGEAKLNSEAIANLIANIK